ncbi:hypothetical protein EH196_07005 [Bacillus sp. C1-1]|nr:hypothetical protein EH196_07005 [Bacillus sp. C1-1]
MLPSRKEKPATFYKPLNKLVSKRAKDLKQLSIHSVYDIKNNYELMGKQQIDDLICIAEAEKSYLTQSRFGNFISIMAIFISLITFAFSSYEAPHIRIVALFYFGLIFLSLLAMNKLENQRIERLRSISFYLEALRQAQIKITHKKRTAS